MAKQIINTGTSANSRNGDSIRSAFNKVNANFTELYDTLVSITTSAQVNADWNATTGMAEILNKPFIPDSQVHSDWNAVAGLAQILNKPTIPAAQVQSDWTQSNNASIEYIKNKPSIPSIAGLATETYVDTAVSNLVDSAPETLNTLNELAAALNDDTSFATTLTTLVGTKANTSDLTWTNVTGKPTFALVANTNSYNSLDDKPTLFSGVYADLSGKPSLFSGSYTDLTNKPAMFSGIYADLSDKPTIPAAQVNSDWNSSSGISQILNKPSLFSGAYADLTGKPVIFSGAWADITGKPTFGIVANTNSYNSLDDKPTIFSGAYADLSGKPVIFSGAYVDLTGKPALFSGSYTDLSNKPSLFSGSYDDLTNKPTIPSLTGYATESFVGTAISNLVDTAPTTLNTLNELAAALNDDPSFATTIATAIGNKADTSSLATVATSGSYADLTNKPTIPSAQVSSDWNSSTGVTQILNKPTLFSGAYADLSGKPSLFSGAYADLSGKPSLFSGSYTDLTNKPDFKEILYLNELLDVNTSGFQEGGTGPVFPAPVANNVLKYNGTGRWIAGTVSYNDLTDKPSSSAFTGDLKFVDNEMRTETYQSIKLTTDALGIVNKRSWIFYGDGALELPTSNLGVGTIQSPAGIWLNVNGVLWQFSSNGAVDFPSVNGTTSLIRSTTSTTINSNGKEWYFGQDGRLTLPTDGKIVNNNNEWTFSSTGALAYPNVALQRDTATVSCPGTASTVVYTAAGQYQHAIKLLIQVEGSAPGNPYDTQACEMIIAKSFRANAIAASVYGVVHTSVAPLATFTANWNALTNRVEVLCATTAIAVSVRIFATEITTSD